MNFIFAALVFSAGVLFPSIAHAFEIQSDAFPPEGLIPPEYTCDGADRSPALDWNNPPAGTKSFVLIVEDPDAPMGTWVHWILYDIPTETSSLEKGIEKGTAGRSSFNRAGYGGPCPPPGPAHRYYFKLYALDALLNLPSERTTERELLEAMNGHILSETFLMGRYGRKT